MDLYDEWDAIAQATHALPPDDVARLMAQAGDADPETRERAEATLIRHYAHWILRCVRIHAARSAEVLQRPGPERSELVAGAFVAFMRALRRLTRPSPSSTGDPTTPQHPIEHRSPHEALAAYSNVRIRRMVHATLVAVRLGMSVDMARVRARVRRAAAFLTQQLGAPPTAQQVSDLLTARALDEIRTRRGAAWRPRAWEMWRLGAVSPATAAQYLSHEPQVVSLEAAGVSRDDRDLVGRLTGPRLIDRIADPGDGPLQLLLRTERNAQVARHLAQIDTRASTPHLRHLIFEMRFGLGGKYVYATDEIASVTGLGPRWLRHIIADRLQSLAPGEVDRPSAAPAPSTPTVRPRRRPRPPGGPR